MNKRKEVESKIGYHFKDPDLLEEALTHPSRVAEGVAARSNQRLEFLGDAVLELVVTELLFRENPEADEGRMTSARAGLVCGPVLADIAEKQLPADFLEVGDVARKNKVDENQAAREDAVEALFGAVYLDGGLPAVRIVFEKLFDSRSLDVNSFLSGHENPKGALQEIIQSTTPDRRPEYEIVRMEGPPHERIFESVVSLGDTKLGSGIGPTKKAAETEAAREALKNISSEKD